MDNKSKKVGFIGLGAMGFGMACNIVKSGFSTTVYDIDKKKIRAVTDTGAIASESIKSLGRDSDVVITILPDEDAVEKVYLEEDSLWGTEDTEITREMIKDIRSFLPHLQFKPVEDVGHGIVFQKPEIINTLIIDFLG